MRNAEGRVRYVNLSEPDIPFEDVGTPTWDGLPLHHYLSLLDMLNPMHRLWSDGRWNKLTVAYGCYWKRCSFCDVSLDYIGRYETATASELAKAGAPQGDPLQTVMNGQKFESNVNDLRIKACPVCSKTQRKACSGPSDRPARATPTACMYKRFCSTRATCCRVM